MNQEGAVGERDLRQHVSLGHKTGPVAAPVAPGPTGALVEELETVLQGGLDLALAFVLNPGLPLVAHQPARDKVVVVCVEDILSPTLRLESFQEVVALQNLGAISTGAARHARCAAVHAVGGRDLEVPPLDVRRSQPVEDLRSKRAIPLASDTLAGADAPDPGILERGQDPGQELLRPGDVVVGHYSDGRPDLWQRCADLEALVGNRGVEDADGNLRLLQGLGQFFQSLGLVHRCHQDHLGRSSGQNAEERRTELINGIVDGGQDHGHIFRVERRVCWNRDRFVTPVADAMDDQTNIAMEPEQSG